MRKFVVSIAVSVGVIASAGTALAGTWTYGPETLEYTTPVCVEDMPCWRAWMGNGEVGPYPAPYLYLPSGPQWDAIAPYFGYVTD